MQQCRFTYLFIYFIHPSVRQDKYLFLMAAIVATAT